jgi:hypothetical protein
VFQWFDWNIIKLPRAKHHFEHSELGCSISQAEVYEV